MKENIIVTGGLGFIGFNFIKYLNQLNYQGIIINIDKRTYAAQYKLKDKLAFFINCNTPILDCSLDINDSEAIQDLIKLYDVKGIINFAAQTHVDFSISNPEVFIKSNINGTFTLLQLARKYNLRYHQVSTDEVYGSVDIFNDNVDQNFKLNPSSPYSSSKTSADLLVLSYYKTFGTKVTITRTTNNYGEYQDLSKLIPKAITKFSNDQKLGVYGDGKNIRNWLYVKDHCSGIWAVYNSNRYGQVFNIGSSVLMSNNEILSIILKQLNKKQDLIEYIQDRKGHDFGYHLNSNKIQKELNWNELYSFQHNLSNTINFYNK